MNTLLLLVLLATTTVQATQLVNDPTAYFGGTGHGDYLEWVDTSLDASLYEQSVFLANTVDTSTGVAVHWYWEQTDDDQRNDLIHVALATKATGWVAFGISEAGGMLGSDMAIFEASNPTVILDAHVIEARYPQTDCVSHDWTLVQYAQEGDFLMVEMTRRADTGDHQDKAIIEDTDALTVTAHRVIAAWGDTDTFHYHGTDRVARGAIRFYTDTLLSDAEVFDATMARNAEGSFIIETGGYTIPGDTDTTYIDFCLTKSEILAQGVPDDAEQLYLVGLRDLVDKLKNVHHVLIIGLDDPSDDVDCRNGDADQGIFGWALGMSPLMMPDNVGMAMLLDSNVQAILMEIHYDNAALESGIVDNTGFELFWTTQPREHELGVTVVGDPSTKLSGNTVSPSGTAEFASHVFECPSYCTDIFLSPVQKVTVLGEFMHMHQKGSRMVNEVIRGGKVVKTSTTEVWEFDQNGNLQKQQSSYEIHAGDSFRTTCFYRVDDPAGLKFGKGSHEEMCMVFVWYYPRVSYSFTNVDGDRITVPWACGYDIDVPICETTHEEYDLGGEAEMGREFGSCNLQAAEEPKFWQCRKRLTS